MRSPGEPLPERTHSCTSSDPPHPVLPVLITGWRCTRVSTFISVYLGMVCRRSSCHSCRLVLTLLPASLGKGQSSVPGSSLTTHSLRCAACYALFGSVDSFTLLFHGHELLQDARLELNYGRRYGLLVSSAAVGLKLGFIAGIVGFYVCAVGGRIYWREICSTASSVAQGRMMPA